LTLLKKQAQWFFSMSTRAIFQLKKMGLPFEAVRYEHLEKGAEFASQATGFPLEGTVKTLVVEISPQSHILVLIAGDRQLDLKRLARALGAKRAELAEPSIAERLTGYHVGGISPFGVKQALPVVMDQDILELEEILINAGQRGTMLKMSPLDVCGALGCNLAAVSIKRDAGR
jgi:Cys-tRNA(Pro)/Cys-tRNA(Cys) deacylase